MAYTEMKRIKDIIDKYFKEQDIEGAIEELRNYDENDIYVVLSFFLSDFEYFWEYTDTERNNQLYFVAELFNRLLPHMKEQLHASLYEKFVQYMSERLQEPNECYVDQLSEIKKFYVKLFGREKYQQLLKDITKIAKKRFYQALENNETIYFCKAIPVYENILEGDKEALLDHIIKRALQEANLKGNKKWDIIHNVLDVLSL